jgi:hypothetical protein
MAVSKDIIVRLSYGELKMELIAEGASWNPDVADDFIRRAKVMWHNTLESMMETDTWDSVEAIEVEDE